MGQRRPGTGPPGGGAGAVRCVFGLLTVVPVLFGVVLVWVWWSDR